MTPQADGTTLFILLEKIKIALNIKTVMLTIPLITLNWSLKLIIREVHLVALPPLLFRGNLCTLASI